MSVSHEFARLALTRLALAASLITLAASAWPPGSTAATTFNTFQGECSGMLGTATWPGNTLHGAPAPLRMVVTFEGGSCSGTLNGKPIDDVPMRDGYIDVYG